MVAFTLWDVLLYMAKSYHFHAISHSLSCLLSHSSMSLVERYAMSSGYRQMHRKKLTSIHEIDARRESSVCDSAMLYREVSLTC